jgi:hypothetical protein
MHALGQGRGGEERGREADPEAVPAPPAPGREDMDGVAVVAGRLRHVDTMRFVGSPDVRLTCGCGAVKVYKQSQINRMRMPFRCGRCMAREKAMNYWRKR